MTQTVTPVTTPDLRADTLTEQDYRDIYREIREKMSLDKFIAVIGSTVTRAWWHLYEKGERPLSWQRKNELRRAVSLPELTPPIAHAFEDVSEDASVWRIGEGSVQRVVEIVGQAPVILHITGDVEIITDNVGVVTDNVIATPVTATTPRKSHKRSHYRGLSIPTPLYDRLDEKRKAAGLTWAELLERVA